MQTMGGSCGFLERVNGVVKFWLRVPVARPRYVALPRVKPHVLSNTCEMPAVLRGSCAFSICYHCPESAS
jgi:hypothetical protein